LSPTQSTGPPQLQIDVHDAYEIGFGRSTYARKEDEISFLMTPVQGKKKSDLTIISEKCQYLESNSSRSYTY
jgi:hypothetical protein